MGQEKWHKALATSCLAADPCGAAMNHYTGHSCRHTFCTRRTLLEALRIQPGEGPCGPALLYSFLRLTEPSWPFPLCLYPTVRPPTPLPPRGERVFKVTPPHERFREPDRSPIYFRPNFCLSLYSFFILFFKVILPPWISNRNSTISSCKP